jgi:hypothetical protein
LSGTLGFGQGVAEYIDVKQRARPPHSPKDDKKTAKIDLTGRVFNDFVPKYTSLGENNFG